MTPIKGTIECSRCGERIPVTAYPMIAVETPVGKLIPALQELFGLEKEHALRKAAVLRKYRSGKNGR